MSQQIKPSYEVVVIGGGMVGAATALGLAQAGLDVLLVEREAPTTQWSDNMPYQTRVSALTRASENMLKNLGAWQGVERRRFHPFTAMHIWEAATVNEIHLSAQEVGAPNLGYVVENAVIQSALWVQCLSQEKLTILLEDTLQGLHLASERSEQNKREISKKVQNPQSCQKATLEFAESGTIEADLIIGADGAFSHTRQLAGIGLDSHDYQQCAVVGCVKTEQSHQDTCWQRYTEEGPFAFLSMGENVSSIAWYLPLEKMSWALSLSDAAFAEAIGEASGYRLGKATEVAERGAFPLVRRHAQQYVKPHFALVGDAAHTINPQAGQGVNLGFLDAAALVEVVTQAKQKGQPIGALPVLRRYERWRRGDNAIVQRSMEFFEGFFNQSSPVLKGLRKQLLPTLETVKPLKAWLIEEALYGRAPRPALTQSCSG